MSLQLMIFTDFWHVGCIVCIDKFVEGQRYFVVPFRFFGSAPGPILCNYHVPWCRCSWSFQEFHTIPERWGTCHGDTSCPTLNAPVLNVNCKAMRPQVRGV